MCEQDRFASFPQTATPSEGNSAGGLLLSPAEDRGVVAKLENMIRTIYVLCARDYYGDPHYGDSLIPAWDGGEDRFGKSHKSKWPAVAAVIMRVGADPWVYIKAQFALCRAKRLPNPQQLCAEAAVATWQQYKEQATSQLQRQLLANHTSLRVAVDPMVHVLKWDESRAARYCLNSTAMANLTPLFRYSLGRQLGFAEVVTRFHDDALLQYVFQKTAYDASWGSLVPLELRHAAADLQQHVSGGSFV